MGNEFAKTDWTTIDGRRVRYLTARVESPRIDWPEAFDGEACPANEPLLLPTLFLHGLGCSSKVWLPTMSEMARRELDCPIVAPDMPGYGRSPAPRGDALGIDDLADWTVRFLDDRELHRVHVAGNSMGCQVALALARRHPERVGGLVLQGPTTGARLVPNWRYAAGLAADAGHETLRYNLRLIWMYTQMGPRRYLSTVRKMLDDDPVGSAKAVRAPVLVIRGGSDSIVPDEAARRLTAALPDAVYMPLDHEAHAIEYNNPKDFVDAMVTFLMHAEEKIGVVRHNAPSSSASQPSAKMVRARSQTTAATVPSTM